MSKPRSPGPGLADDGVEVRAVVVDQPVDAVDQVADLADVRVEQPQRVGAGQHEAGDLVVERLLEGRRCPSRRWRRLGIGPTSIAGDGGAGGVGAVAAVGDAGWWSSCCPCRGGRRP